MPLTYSLRGLKNILRIERYKKILLEALEISSRVLLVGMKINCTMAHNI